MKFLSRFVFNITVFYLCIFSIFGYLPCYYSLRRKEFSSNLFLSIWFFLINLVKFFFNVYYALTETHRISDVASKDLLLFLLMACQNILFRIMILIFIAELVKNHLKVHDIANQLSGLMKTIGKETKSKYFESSLVLKIVLDFGFILILLISVGEVFPGDLEMFCLTLIDATISFLITDLIYFANGNLNSFVEQVLVDNMSTVTKVSNHLIDVFKIKENFNIIFGKSLLILFGYKMLANISFVSLHQNLRFSLRNPYYYYY